jgi:hypothetical protein
MHIGRQQCSNINESRSRTHVNYPSIFFLQNLAMIDMTTAMVDTRKNRNGKLLTVLADQTTLVHS